jgi:DNA-binding transcriptional ArsR family regulator
VPKSDAHIEHRVDGGVDEAMVSAIVDSAHALATGSRVRLLFALRDSERTVAQLAEAAQITSAAASQQLRVLRHLKLVAARREGQSMRYRLYDDHVAALLDESRNHAEHARRGWESPAPALAKESSR